MKIKELSTSERPREKMMALGPESLGSAELLAVLLRSGTRDESALDLAHRMLRSADGSLLKLFDMSSDALQSIPGVGPCKAAGIMAAFELGKRFMSERPSTRKVIVSGPRKAYEIIAPRLRGLRHEECWVMYIAIGGKLLGTERQTVGGSGSTVIDPHAIIRRAIEKGARSIIVAHNHPTGNPEPSPADLQQTRLLERSAAACGLHLEDHIIVTEDSFFSFSDDRVYPL